MGFTPDTKSEHFSWTVLWAANSVHSSFPVTGLLRLLCLVVHLSLTRPLCFWWLTFNYITYQPPPLYLSVPESPGKADYELDVKMIAVPWCCRKTCYRTGECRPALLIGFDSMPKYSIGNYYTPGGLFSGSCDMGKKWHHIQCDNNVIVPPGPRTYMSQRKCPTQIPNWIYIMPMKCLLLPHLKNN